MCQRAHPCTRIRVHALQCASFSTAMYCDTKYINTVADSFRAVIMWHIAIVAVLVGTVTVLVPSAAGIEGLMYMKEIDGAFDEFLMATDNVKVVYFCKGI